MANREQQVEAVMRQKQALDLRIAGLPYQDIADRLGYAARGAAHKAVMSALTHTLQEPADNLRQIEVARLDKMLLALWPKVLKADVAAIDRALRIAERRARLLGLDAPTRQELTGAEGGPMRHDVVVTWDDVIEVPEGGEV